MRFLKKILIGLVSLIVLLCGVAYLLPRHVHVERTVSIGAPPEAIFPYVNSLQKSAHWSPWLGIDPNISLTYEGPEEGVGNKLTWSSDHPDVGSGQQEITASTLNQSVESSLDFGDMGTAVASFQLDPEQNSTRVTWSLVADMGTNPIGRWMGLMMDKWVGADYEKGLNNLKVLIEKP